MRAESVLHKLSLTMASALVMVPSLFRLLVLGGLVIYFEVAARRAQVRGHARRDYAAIGKGRAASSEVQRNEAMTPRPRLTTSVLTKRCPSGVRSNA
jgi:hypothetical protein